MVPVATGRVGLRAAAAPISPNSRTWILPAARTCDFVDALRAFTNS